MGRASEVSRAPEPGRPAASLVVRPGRTHEARTQVRLASGRYRPLAQKVDRLRGLIDRREVPWCARLLCCPDRVFSRPAATTCGDHLVGREIECSDVQPADTAVVGCPQV